MNGKFSSFLFSLCLALLVGGAAFFVFNERVERTKLPTEEEVLSSKLDFAKSHLDRSHLLKARALLLDSKKALTSKDYKERWEKLALATGERLEDFDLLSELFHSNPALFSQNEPLSLQLAKNFLIEGRYNDYAKLKDSWKYHASKPHEWLLLEADSLALQGHIERAKELLSSQKFSEQEEEERLLRLAVISLDDHPKVPWEHLTRALKNTNNPGDFHFYRSMLLHEGDHLDLVKEELKKAIEKNSENTFFRETLLDVYLSEHRYEDALQLAKASLSQPTSDKLWLKALFLGSIYKPIKNAIADKNPPQGELTPFLYYLLALPQGHPWSDALISGQPRVVQMSEKLSEANWLQVIEDLKQRKDLDALEILKNHPEMAFFAPSLYQGLLETIAYKYSHLNLQVPPQATLEPKGYRAHPIFKELAKRPLSNEVESLLSTKEAYSALFLAAGWNEASLYLHEIERLPSSFPKWVAYGMTKAIETNRGHDKALAFAKEQQPSPQLSLLLGELYLKEGESDQAVNTLQPLLEYRSEIGERAALLLSKAYESKNEVKKALIAAQKNERFKDSLLGQERIAALYLRDRNAAKAEEIYRNILDRSSDAKVYFAKKAELQKEYRLAYKLILSLAEEYPERADLKQKKRELEDLIKKNEIR